MAGLADQIAKLKNASCTHQSIYQEQVNNVLIKDRVEFVKVLGTHKGGDVLVFSVLSHAAQLMIHMIEIKARVAGVNDCEEARCQLNCRPTAQARSPRIHSLHAEGLTKSRHYRPLPMIRFNSEIFALSIFLRIFFKYLFVNFIIFYVKNSVYGSGIGRASAIA